MHPLGTFTQFPNRLTKDAKEIERLFSILLGILYMVRIVITDGKVRVECVANHENLMMLENAKLWIFITSTVKCIKGNSSTLAGPVSH
jgi:hypothetical protein